MPTTKPTIHERRIQIEQQAQRFVAKHLSEEYAGLVTKFLDVLEKKHPALLRQGDIKIYAAGVVHALASHNFLFGKGADYQTSPGEIADFYGIKQSGMGQRSAQLSRAIGMSRLDVTWLAGEAREEIQKMRDMMAETMALLARGAAPEDLLAEMPFFSTPESTREEFVDEERASGVGFYEFMDRATATNMSARDAEKIVARMINKDPDFLDLYEAAVRIHEDLGHPDVAETFLQEAYERGVRLIADEDGNWPLHIDYGFLENRHILRAFARRIVYWYGQGKTTEALELARKVLRVSPEDNLGLRYYILAIREGMSAEQFKKRFDRGGFWDQDIWKWFESKLEKYPEEFEDIAKMMEE